MRFGVSFERMEKPSVKALTETDSLVSEMAKALRSFEKKLTPRRPGKASKVPKGARAKGNGRRVTTRRARETGTRFTTYSTIQKMYGLIIADKRFGKHLELRKSGRELGHGLVIIHAETIRKTVSLSFRVAFPDVHRSWRQRAHIWGGILATLWRDQINKNSVFREILRYGGIEKFHRDRARETDQ